MHNIKLHKIFWIFLIFFPAFTPIFNKVNQGQIALHITFLIMYSLLIAVKSNQIKVIQTYLYLPIISTIYFIGITLINTGENIVVGDIIDAIRPLIYFVYFSFPLVFPIEIKEVREVMNLLIILMLFQFIFSLLVYVPDMYPLVDYYKGRMSNDISILQFRRWSGTFIFPSDYSFYISFIAYLIFVKIALSKNKIKEIMIKLPLTLIVLISAIMTQSRGGLITIIVTLLATAVFTRSFLNTRVIIGILLLSSIGIISINAAYNNGWINMEYIASTFHNIGDERGTTAHRILEAKLTIEYIKNYWIFGAGGASEEIAKQIPVLETLYGYYLIKWGIIGLILYYIFVLFVIKHGLRGYKNLELINDIKSYDAIVYIVAATMLVISVPLIFGFSSAISDRFKGLPLFFMMSGYVVMISRNSAMQVKNAKMKLL